VAARQVQPQGGTDTVADSPLLVAAYGKDLRLMQWLVKQGINVNAPVSADDAFTALHAAVSTRTEM
jgi:hypothetical protein